jgi:hypothetical protein
MAAIIADVFRCHPFAMIVPITMQALVVANGIRKFLIHPELPQYVAKP